MQQIARSLQIDPPVSQRKLAETRPLPASSPVPSAQQAAGDVFESSSAIRLKK